MEESINELVLNHPAYAAPIKSPADIKAFFRMLWFELHLDFTPDDDFAAFGFFSDEVAGTLNKRMDEAFELQHDKVYDLLVQVMQEEDPK